MKFSRKLSLALPLVILCVGGHSVLAADTPAPTTSTGPVRQPPSGSAPQSTIAVSPLTAAQLKDPKAALLAVGKVVGAAFQH